MSKLAPRIITGIICIVISGISGYITIKTYNEINDKEVYNKEMNYLITKNLLGDEEVVSPGRLNYEKKYSAFFTIIREPIEWRAKYNQSNRFAILYSSVFVFCISLCCLTYICVKK